MHTVFLHFHFQWNNNNEFSPLNGTNPDTHTHICIYVYYQTNTGSNFQLPFQHSTIYFTCNYVLSIEYQIEVNNVYNLNKIMKRVSQLCNKFPNFHFEFRLVAVLPVWERGKGIEFGFLQTIFNLYVVLGQTNCETFFEMSFPYWSLIIWTEHMSKFWYEFCQRIESSEFQKSLTNNKTSMNIEHGEQKSICNMRFANG